MYKVLNSLKELFSEHGYDDETLLEKGMKRIFKSYDMLYVGWSNRVVGRIGSTVYKFAVSKGGILQNIQEVSNSKVIANSVFENYFVYSKHLVLPEDEESKEVVTSTFFTGKVLNRLYYRDDSRLYYHLCDEAEKVADEISVTLGIDLDRNIGENVIVHPNMKNWKFVDIG